MPQMLQRTLRTPFAFDWIKQVLKFALSGSGTLNPAKYRTVVALRSHSLGAEASLYAKIGRSVLGRFHVARCISCVNLRQLFPIPLELLVCQFLIVPRPIRIELNQ